MKVNIVDVYDFSLVVMAYAVLAWLIKTLNNFYGVSLSKTYWCLIGGVAVIIAVWLYFKVQPGTISTKVKVILYGVLAGTVLGLGLVGWGGNWVP